VGSRCAICHLNRGSKVRKAKGEKEGEREGPQKKFRRQGVFDHRVEKAG